MRQWSNEQMIYVCYRDKSNEIIYKLCFDRYEYAELRRYVNWTDIFTARVVYSECDIVDERGNIIPLE